MSEYKLYCYGVKYKGALMDVSISQDEAAKTAKLIPGSDVIKLNEQLKQQEESHETTE